MKPSEAAKLQAYLHRWRAVNPYRWRQGAQVVANDWMRDAAFTDIKLAAILESPVGATITDVVKDALPFPESAEAAVMVDAVKIAAKGQTQDQVVGRVLLGALAALVLWSVFGGS